MQYILPLTLFILPTYLIRFNFGGIRLNFLMLWIPSIFIYVFTVAYKEGAIRGFVRSLNKTDLIFKIPLFLFFLSGIISLLVGGFTAEKLGQFIVLFLEPFLLFLIARYLFFRSESNSFVLEKSIFIFLGLSGLYAVFQYITLFGLPPEYLGNSIEPKRALSFFEYPNAYALFVAPLLVFTFPKLLSLFKGLSIDNIQFRLYPILCWALGGIGLGVSLSRGGWLALFIPSALFVLLKADIRIKQMALVVFLASMLIIFSVPVLRYRVILPFMGEKSSVSRLSLSNTAIKMIKDSPVFGKGLLGFSENFEKYNTDPGLSHYKYPHNLILALWLETGVLGLLSFVWILFLVFYKSWKIKSKLHYGLALFIFAVCIHGLVDIPYFKNDLAGLFWLLIAIL